MKIISHRGNLSGPNPKYENSPNYIQKAIDAGFEVEIDVWFLNNNFYLGHDSPDYLIELTWLKEKADKLWCHAKNFETVYEMSKEKILNYFWHENDKMTLTSQGVPWCYPGNFILNGITVCLNKTIKDINVMGICTDYALFFKERI